MKKIIAGLSAAALLTAIAACSSDDETVKDTQKPAISEAGITPNPVDCQTYSRGEAIPFQYIFTDNMELGSYNIEIHNNFDHHTHGTSATDCPLDKEKTATNPWVFNKDYTIPAGSTTYKGRVDIQIPGDIEPGDYHFMIRVTDKAGWQELKSMSIKIK